MLMVDKCIKDEYTDTIQRFFLFSYFAPSLMLYPMKNSKLQSDYCATKSVVHGEKRISVKRGRERKNVFFLNIKT